MGDHAAAGLNVVGLAASEAEARKRNKGETAEARDYKDRQEDTSMRTEATYRAKRGMLQGAIEDFYKQKGWPLPQIGEGAFTSRPLPGDKPLYEGYDVPRASWNYGKIQPEDVAPISTAPTPTPSPAPTPQVDLAGINNPQISAAIAPQQEMIAQNQPPPAQQQQLAMDPRIQDVLKKYGY